MCALYIYRAVIPRSFCTGIIMVIQGFESFSSFYSYRFVRNIFHGILELLVYIYEHASICFVKRVVLNWSYAQPDILSALVTY
ncbi:hypothetical protein AQUCO_04000042v1 [Aquilegia coerulea]|uniref:Uncharacterized protein n=1 Tax=Aquilegia coerulea TaxID=218851 RepID=A0A2G5CSA3_AQUCA|nr:hypothetical protein AQUCO_04000042v1 [Aquilegia coerulea]